ncbi:MULTISPECIES: hypothetical protein [Ramlibacter]|uniref:DUF2059 domain-containing protein n=1 Tax=Ramlibacter aquaticus TaxID=2780094 RepID=A0ABR9SJ81_9BURK|nr:MULTISPECIES: hypothetical protein [Ramlibacter]MBE7942082.1 hypothetical protein [Ramlibacter aquaticus]
MRTRHSLIAALALAAGAVYAQGAAPAPAPAAPAAPAAPSSPAKRELIARILKAQQPSIEAIAQRLVEQPAAELMNAAGNALPQRVAKDKQEAVGRDIQAEVQKYVNDTAPQVRQRAVALGPSTIGALLDERFTEDELRQVAAFLESPVYTKFQRTGDDMQRVLVEKLIAETRPTVEPRVQALEQSIARKLGVSGAPQGAASASKPAKK